MSNLMEVMQKVAVIMTAVGIIVGIVGAFFVFFMFMSKKNEDKLKGFWKWVYDYLHFRNFIIEELLKFFYVLFACICIGIGVFHILCLQLVTGFGILIFGNLAVRIFYEFTLMIVLICRNVSDINKKLGGHIDNGMTFKEYIKPPMPKKDDFLHEKKEPVQEEAWAKTAEAGKPEIAEVKVEVQEVETVVSEETKED